MVKAQRDLDSTRLGPGVARLLGGTLGGQCLILLAAPVLSRLYSPTDFGIFGVFLSLIGTGSTVGTLRYEMAIVLASKKALIRSLFWGVIAIGVVFSAIVMAVLWGVPALATWLFSSNDLDNLWWLLPSALLIRNAMLATTGMASKLNAFGRLGFANMLGRGADLLMKIVLASSMGWQGLAIGMIVGDLVSIAVAIVSTPNLLAAPPRQLARYADAFQRYRHFPLYNLPSALGSAVAKALPVMGLATLFGPVAAGCYEMANRTLGRPSALLGNQFYTVFYPKSVAQLARSGSVASIVEVWLPRLLLLLAPPFLLMALFGQSIFVFVFGPAWSEAGLYAAILAPAFFLGSVAIPIRVFNTLNQQRLAMIWQGSLVAGTAAAIALGAVTGNDVTTVSLISGVWALAYLAHLYMTIRLSGADPRRIWSGLLIPLRRLARGATAVEQPSDVSPTVEARPASSLRQSA